MLSTCSNCFAEMPDGESTCPVCGYSPDKDSGKYPMALPAGTVLNGRYILGRTLGQGGFGITYVAKDHKTGNLVAVKEYFPETLATRTNDKTISAYTDQREENFSYGKECFLKEAETLAQFIGNPNIVRVYSYFEENNTAYFVMDYVDGVSLRDYLKEQGKISWEKAKELLFPIMDALSEVHSKGIIHRDVTPDNIYITKDGVVKLLDFGAARYSLGDRSRSLDVVLKPGFAPREQYSRRSRQGPYTDVYALAATYYFAITGRLPPDSIDRQDHDELILPSSLGVKIPPTVEDALCKGLAVSSLERFQNMEEFKQALLSLNPVSADTPKQTAESKNDTIGKQKTDNNVDTETKQKKKRKFTKKTAVIAACAFVLSLSITISVLSIAFNAGDSTPVSVKVTEESTKKTTTEKQTEKKTQATTKATDSPERTTESEAFDNSDIGDAIIVTITAIENLDGFYSNDNNACGSLVEVDNGWWFITLYEKVESDGLHYAYCSLFNFCGNEINEKYNSQMYCLDSDNYMLKYVATAEKDGDNYFVIIESYFEGDLLYIKYYYYYWDKYGVDLPYPIIFTTVYDYKNDMDMYYLYDDEVDEESFYSSLGEYNLVCVLDLLGESEGNVLTFDEFRNKYE